MRALFDTASGDIVCNPDTVNAIPDIDAPEEREMLSLFENEGKDDGEIKDDCDCSELNVLAWLGLPLRVPVELIHADDDAKPEGVILSLLCDVEVLLSVKNEVKTEVFDDTNTEKLDVWDVDGILDIVDKTLYDNDATLEPLPDAVKIAVTDGDGVFVRAITVDEATAVVERVTCMESDEINDAVDVKVSNKDEDDIAVTVVTGLSVNRADRDAATCGLPLLVWVDDGVIDNDEDEVNCSEREI